MYYFRHHMSPNTTTTTTSTTTTTTTTATTTTTTTTMVPTTTTTTTTIIYLCTYVFVVHCVDLYNRFTRDGERRIDWSARTSTLGLEWDKTSSTCGSVREITDTPPTISDWITSSRSSKERFDTSAGKRLQALNWKKTT